MVLAVVVDTRVDDLASSQRSELEHIARFLEPLHSDTLDVAVIGEDVGLNILKSLNRDLNKQKLYLLVVELVGKFVVADSTAGTVVVGTVEHVVDSVAGDHWLLEMQ